MAKIAMRSGHSDKSPGAVALLNERVEVKAIEPLVTQLLRPYNEMISCNSTNAYPQELNDGINIANRNKADLFVSLHMNKAYSEYKGALGSEICLHSVASQDTKNKANAILKNLENLGFKNRGIKYRSDLGELTSTNMEAMIIEICFVEATTDVDIYRKSGKDKIAMAIASGIDSRVKAPSKIKCRNLVVYKKDTVDIHSANILSWGLEDCKVTDHTQVDKYSATSIYSVGANTGIKSNVTIKGNNRFDTVIEVLKRLKKI